MTAKCQRQSGRISQLTPALERHYYLRGRECALGMNEDAPMVEFMRAAIQKLLEDASYIDNPTDVIGAWDEGFRSGIIDRVNHWKSQQDQFQKLMENPASISIECRNTPRRIDGTIKANKQKGSVRAGFLWIVLALVILVIAGWTNRANAQTNDHSIELGVAVKQLMPAQPVTSFDYTGGLPVKWEKPAQTSDDGYIGRFGVLDINVRGKRFTYSDYDKGTSFISWTYYIGGGSGHVDTVGLYPDDVACTDGVMDFSKKGYDPVDCQFNPMPSLARAQVIAHPVCKFNYGDPDHIRVIYRLTASGKNAVVLDVDTSITNGTGHTSLSLRLDGTPEDYTSSSLCQPVPVGADHE